MRKLIAVMNITVDGFCDHTYGIADDEIHQHYTDLLNSADTVLYGRITYQLMEDHWPNLLKNPGGNKADNDFAASIDNISKVVFSRTLKDVKWKTARLAKQSIKDEIVELKQQPGGDILVGSPSLIVAAMNLGLVDEYQLSIIPTIAGKGLPLMKNLQEKINLKLVKSKTFGCGVITLYYKAV